jgi:HAD superfamily hydrolase (TIGR01509 family)
MAGFTLTPDEIFRPSAVLFDMDGTLTQPMLDFPRIKAEMGIGPGPILESLARLDESRRSEAEAVLLQHEEIAAANSRLNPGCEELLAWLAAQEIPTALITRNSRLSAETVLHRHQLRIDHVITREDGPFKPSPAPLHLACHRLGLNGDSRSSAVYDSVWMVGDGQYDVEAAHAAAMRAVWISHGKTRTFAAEPWMTVTDLLELTVILKRARGHR